MLLRQWNPSDEANRHAIGELVLAYEALDDAEREEELEATIKLFHLIAHVESCEFARRWLGRQIELIREETSR